MIAAEELMLSQRELGERLNVLLEAERAGAKLLAAYVDELPVDSDESGRLRMVQHDEARNCAVLIHLVLEAGVVPSAAVGDFYRKGLEIRGFPERLQFLNRGQRWVARRLAEILPRLPPSAGRSALQVMYDSHLHNVALCEEMLP